MKLAKPTDPLPLTPETVAFLNELGIQVHYLVNSLLSQLILYGECPSAPSRSMKLIEGDFAGVYCILVFVALYTVG